MKKAISLILALALCCALAVPSLAAEDPAASLTPEAAAAYLGIMEDIRNLDDVMLFSYVMDDCRGRIIDIDNDGTEELIVSYAKGMGVPVLYCDIWTIKNGEPVHLFNDELGAYAGAGPRGYLMLVESMGETWLFLLNRILFMGREDQYGTLYQLADGAYAKQHTFYKFISYVYTDENGYSGMTDTPTLVRYYIDGVEVSENEFSSRPIREIKRILNGGINDDVQDESLPFEDLIAELQKQAGLAVTVTVNGKAVSFPDAAPFIDENDRTMVPLRAVADAMGLTVDWDASAREACFTNGVRTIWFPIDSDTARKSDGSTLKMDTAAVIVNERTYAPVRYLAEYFGYTVDWDAAARTVLIAR